MKRKFLYYRYQTAFDEAGSWSFLMNLQKMLFLTAENSSQDVNLIRHSSNCKNIFQVSSEGPTVDINENDGEVEK